LAARLTQQGLLPPDWAPAEVLAVGSTTSLASLGLAAVTTLMIGRVRIFLFYGSILLTFLATFLFSSKFLLRAYFLSIRALLFFFLLLLIALMIAYMEIEQVVSATGSITICSTNAAY
jgi:hypothetical protein